VVQNKTSTQAYQHSQNTPHSRLKPKYQPNMFTLKNPTHLIKQSLTRYRFSIAGTRLPLITLVTMLTWFTLTLPSLGKDITVSAQLDRASVAVGQAAVLDVTIKGDSNAQVNMPEIDGLLIKNRGQSTNVQFGNGKMISSLTKRYIVIPDKEGDYKIAPITIEIQGKKHTIKATLKLTVTKGAPPENPNPNNPHLNPKDLAHIEIIGLKDHAVVGELIPVEIRAFFKNNNQVSLADIKSNPTLDSSSFTVKLENENPRQGRATIDEESYYVVIFKAAISPIKAGEFELPFTMEATMRMRDPSPKRPRRNTRLNDPFADAFFGDIFTRSVKKEIELHSDPFKMKVTAAPLENQPEGFNGAVGQFTINATAPTGPIRAGDPITLTVHVSGNGNLTRLKMPHMVDGSGWKTYPAKDHLEGANSLLSSGTKVFEQTIIPRNPAVTSIPAIELVYFDPEKGEYQTIRTAPIPIKVLPGTNITANDDSNTAVESSDPNATKDSSSKNLAPYSHLGWLRKSRLNQSVWLLATTAASTTLLLALAAGLAISRKRNTTERKAAAAKDREIQTELQQMDKAANTKDAQTFFVHARRVIQLRWSHQLQMQPHAITSTDLPHDSHARAIMDMADTLTFSGESTDALDFPAWKKRIQSA